VSRRIVFRNPCDLHDRAEPPRTDDAVCLSESDCFAVGDNGKATGPITGANTLVEHWNGSVWSVMPSPNPNEFPADFELHGVSCPTTSSCYAVGWDANAFGFDGATRHDAGGTLERHAMVDHVQPKLIPQRRVVSDAERLFRSRGERKQIPVVLPDTGGTLHMTVEHPPRPVSNVTQPVNVGRFGSGCHRKRLAVFASSLR